MDKINRCKTLRVCQVISCVDCPSSANIAPTGIVHQSLVKVDTTNTDKRAELDLCFLRMFGAGKIGAFAKKSKLDKRECPHFCVPTRVIHRGSLVVFPIPLRFLKRFEVYDLLVPCSTAPRLIARGWRGAGNPILGCSKSFAWLARVRPYGCSPRCLRGFVVAALPINLLQSRSRMRVSGIRGMSYSCHWAISHPKKT
jgi:hypothetical protein